MATLLQGKAYLAQVIGLVSAVATEVEKAMNAGLTRDQILDTVPKNLDVASLRRQFAGDDKDNGDQFDESFAGLVKTATGQILLR